MLDGLGEVFVDAEARALLARVVAGLAGGDDDGDARVEGADLLERLEAVHLGQRHVEQDGVGAVVLEDGDALLARVGFRHAVAFALERALVERGEVFLVFDDEDALRCGHAGIIPLANFAV